MGLKISLHVVYIFAIHWYDCTFLLCSIHLLYVCTAIRYQFPGGLYYRQRSTINLSQGSLTFAPGVYLDAQTQPWKELINECLSFPLVNQHSLLPPTVHPGDTGGCEASRSECNFQMCLRLICACGCVIVPDACSTRSYVCQGDINIRAGQKLRCRDM